MSMDDTVLVRDLIYHGPEGHVVTAAYKTIIGETVSNCQCC
jgi:hypothetical protein